jgi:hypothetical protein
MDYGAGDHAIFLMWAWLQSFGVALIVAKLKDNLSERKFTRKN